MAQHVIPAAQLVPQYKLIGRCNNYAVLQSIPCSLECKIDGEQVETPKNPFVTPANIHTVEAFMNRLAYQGVFDKVSAFFTKNLAQLWQTINSPNIPKRIEEDYHSIKDYVPLVSVYTTRNVSVRGMLIPDVFLTTEVRETDDFKEYETVFIKVSILMNQPQPVVSTQGTNRNTPRAYRSPTISANPLEMKKRKQTAGEYSLPRRIIKKKQPIPSILPPGDDRERDAIAEATLLNEESYASIFVDSILNDEGADVDDTGSKIEPESQKENPERVSNDDETKKQKEVEQDMKEKENEEVGKEHNIVEKEVPNETNVETEKTNDIEVLKHYNTVVLELTIAKTNAMIKTEMPRLVKFAVDKDREVSPVDISDMVSKEFAAHGPKMIEELLCQYMQNTTLNLYPKTSSSTATKSYADLQQQLYLNMKEKHQDQATDPKIWEILKASLKSHNFFHISR
ncbi:hypothetical protein Tco_0079102 [Tanacetum coccineum]